MPIPKGKKYTADEFFALIPESNSERYELIKGEIIALAAPNIVHQRISGELSWKLREFIKRKKGRCEVFSAPTDVQLSFDTVVQPDIFIACDPDKFDDQKYNGAPDLVVEITSTNRSDDFIRKLALYSESGVREYWIVDTLYKRVMVYLFEQNDFPNIYTFDTPIPVGIYNGELEINIDKLMTPADS